VLARSQDERSGGPRTPVETFGAADRIHVSAEMRNALGDTYLFESRGKIDIKGKGMMETYFLIGRRNTVLSF
jgi:adenylate cyclase